MRDTFNTNRLESPALFFFLAQAKVCVFGVFCFVICAKVGLRAGNNKWEVGRGIRRGRKISEGGNKPESWGRSRMRRNEEVARKGVNENPERTGSARSGCVPQESTKETNENREEKNCA